MIDTTLTDPQRNALREVTAQWQKRDALRAHGGSLGRLKRLGLVEFDAERRIRLTPAGEIAQDLLHRGDVLEREVGHG